MNVCWSLVVLLAVAGASSANSDSCLAHAEEQCMEPGSGWDQGPCDAVHGGFRGNSDNLHQIMIQNFEDSFKFLLLGSHFSSDEVNRMGFHKYLQGYSDKMWGQGKDLMKYILKRGGKMGQQFKVTDYQSEATSEVASLSALLDSLKVRAEDSILAHKHALNKKVHYDNAMLNSYDPGVANFLQEELIEGFEDDIRHVAGKLNVLAKISRNDNTRSLGLHLFDQGM